MGAVSTIGASAPLPVFRFRDWRDQIVLGTHGFSSRSASRLVTLSATPLRYLLVLPQGKLSLRLAILPLSRVSVSIPRIHYTGSLDCCKVADPAV